MCQSEKRKHEVKGVPCFHPGMAAESDGLGGRVIRWVIVGYYERM